MWNGNGGEHPICKYPPRYDFRSHKQKNIPAAGSEYAHRRHEEIMPSPGNSIRAARPYSIARFTPAARLAVFSILRIPPSVASGCKTAKYRKLQYPREPREKREIAGQTGEKGQIEPFRSKTLAPEVPSSTF